MNTEAINAAMWEEARAYFKAGVGTGTPAPEGGEPAGEEQD